ncbi:MAG: hypothetical protein SFZ23_13175 [Planctomycetota bacterium]|nr:hypothetical protein [Planctomycetota bacterium]
MNTIARISSVAALAAVAGLAQFASAQTFQKAYGTTAVETTYSVEVASTCQFVTAGARVDPNNRAAHVSMLDAEGVSQWHRTLVSVNNPGFSQAYSIRESVPLTTVPQSFFVGYESTFVANQGIGLMRVDPLGNLIWAWNYQGAAFVDLPAGVSVREFRDGGAALVGRGVIPNTPLSGILIRVRPDGSPLFNRGYNLPVGTEPARISFSDLRATDQGFVIVGSILERSFSRTFGLLVRTDFNGNVTLARSYPMPQGEMQFDGLEVDKDGTIVVSGRMSATAGAPDEALVVARLSPGGNPIWFKQSRGFIDGYAATRIDTNGDIVIGGTNLFTQINEPLASIIRIDPAGNFIDRMSYGGPGGSDGHAVIQHPKFCGYALAGATSLNAAPGTSGMDDFFLVRASDTLRAGCFDLPSEAILLDVVTTQRVLNLTPRDQSIASPANVLLRPLTVNDIRYCFRERCRADFNCDGQRDFFDYLDFAAAQDALDPKADVNCDGNIDFFDYLDFVEWYDAGC